MAAETTLLRVLDEERVVKVASEHAQQVHAKLSFPPPIRTAFESSDRQPYDGDGASTLATALQRHFSEWGFRVKQLRVVATYDLPPTTSLHASAGREIARSVLTNSTGATARCYRFAAEVAFHFVHRPRITVVCRPGTLAVRVAYPQLLVYLQQQGFSAAELEDLQPSEWTFGQPGSRQPGSFFDCARRQSTADIEHAAAVEHAAETTTAAEQAEKIRRRQEAKQLLQRQRQREAKARQADRRR